MHTPPAVGSRWRDKIVPRLRFIVTGTHGYNGITVIEFTDHEGNAGEIKLEGEWEDFADIGVWEPDLPDYFSITREVSA